MVDGETGNTIASCANESTARNDDSEGADSQIPKSPQEEFRNQPQDKRRLRKEDQRGSEGDGQEDVLGPDGTEENRLEQEQRAKQLHQRAQ